MRKITIILAVTFLGSLIVGNSQVKQTQEESFDLREQLEPVRERNIELTIALVGYDERASHYVGQNTFNVGEQVQFAMTMTNRMAERTVIGWGNVLFQTRVNLQRDGQDVAYLPDISDELNRVDRHGYQGNSKFIELFPNEPKRVSVLLLKNWYPSLEAGQYRLKVKYIFFGQGKPIHSNEATFDVVPQSNP